jgi:secreted trypsin-like serine protease
MKSGISNQILASVLLSMLAHVVMAQGKNPIGLETSDMSEVINGAVGSTSTYPWIVHLADSEGNQFCGASLISPTWVLTAGHCFLNFDGDAVDIPTGAMSTIVLNSDTTNSDTSSLATAAIVAQIGQIIVHPSYRPDGATSPNRDDFDIALVELTAAVNLQPVQLLSGDAPAVPAETMALVMGWGTTEVDADNMSIKPSTTLLTANQKIVSNEACSIVYGGSITSNMICAGGVTAADTTDTCQGDSGGPLTIAKGNSYVQVGLSSFGGTETGPVCGDPNAPGVYASVAALASFIAQHATDATFTTLEEENAAPVLTTSISGTTVTISWSAFASASGYNLFYAPFPAQTPVASLDLGATNTVSAPLPPGSAFYIAVQPYTASGPTEVFSNVATFSVPQQAASFGTKMVTVAEVEASCSGVFDTSPTEQSLTLTVDGTRAIFRGLIDSSTPQKVTNLINNNPEVKTIIMAYGPGSDDDDANLVASKMIYDAGFATCVPDNGEVASGATDFFMSGVVRRLGNSTFLGVHSWAGDDAEGADLPRSDPEHQKYLDFYTSIDVNPDFYWFTLEAASSSNMHNMTDAERVTWAIQRP